MIGAGEHRLLRCWTRRGKPPHNIGRVVSSALQGMGQRVTILSGNLWIMGAAGARLHRRNPIDNYGLARSLLQAEVTSPHPVF